MHPDPNDNIIQLSDRVKELSYTTGTSNMVLEGAAPGFSRFQDFYPQSGLVFYAITDGSRYEVGSGHYLATGTTPFYSSEQIRRYPFRSSSSNTKVDWPAGTKEVYVTYPAPFSVFTAFGVDERFSQPQRSGIAFWDNDGVASGTNILNYDSSGNWDKDNHFLGLHTHTPGYAIDIGGPAHYSILKASGLFLNTSGIIFSGGYDGGGQHSTRQVDPFLKNQVDATTGSSSIIGVSGWVNESLVLKTQAAAQIFAGPLNDCGGGCPDGYPAFRVLHHTDIPDLSDFYLTGYNIDPQAMSGIPFFHSSGVLTYDKGFVWNDDVNKLGINHSNPQVELDLVGEARISSNLIVGGNLEVSGNLDVAGTTTYIDSTNVTIWDKQLELASMSGNATHDQMDSYINDGGLLVRSSGDGNTDTGDKKWTWENTSNTWKSHTSNGILIGVKASGMIFANGTAISGAYQGGSGIDINGFNIDIGNVFSVSGNDNAAYGASNQQVHQADNIVVSGVSGVSTWITKTGSKTTLHIDPSALSGVLQTQVSANATAALNRWPYASGVGNSGLLKSELFKVSGVGGLIPTHSGFFSEELHLVSGVGGLIHKISGVAGGWDSVTGKGLIHAVSGYVLDSGYAMSGSLQYQIDNLGSAGETNQNAFTSFRTINHDASTRVTLAPTTKEEVMLVASGEDNSIALVATNNGGAGSDKLLVSGDNRIFVTADNEVRTQIKHNETIDISGGYGLTTTNSAGTVTVAWSGGGNLFSLRGDSDAGAGGSTISSDGPSAVNISGDAYITTTRVGDTVKIAWSGGDNAFNWFKGDPATTLSSINSSTMVGADKMLVFDADTSSWKTATLTELSTEINAADTGDASNSDLLGASGALDARISASGHALSGVFDADRIANSGFFSRELHLVSGVGGLMAVNSGFFSEELHEVSGVGGLLSLKANLADPTFTGTPDAPTAARPTRDTQLATTKFTHDALYAVSGHDNDYRWFPSPNSLSGIDDTHIDSASDKILLWDNTANSGWKSMTIAELDDKIGAGADAGDPDQAIFNSIQGQTIAQMGPQHWDYASHGGYKDNTNIDAGSTSDNLFFVGDTASGIAVNILHSGVNKYIKISSDLPAHSGFFSEELHEVSGVGGLMAANSGFFSEELHEVSGVGGLMAANSGFFSEELHEVSGVGGLMAANSGFFSEELHKVSGVNGLLDLKADLAGPTFTGTPAGPTAAATTNSTQLATTAFVHDVVAASGEDHYEDVRASGQILKDLIDTNVTNIALKANIASPTFTGTPAGPTAAAATNTTQLATTAFVRTEVSNLVDSAPAALDTLNELAAAIGDDASFSTTMTNSLATKAPLASPTFTGTPAGPTAAATTDTTQLATTAFVHDVVAASGEDHYEDVRASGQFHVEDLRASGQLLKVHSGSGIDIYDAVTITANLNKDYYQKIPNSLLFPYDGNDNMAIGKDAQAWTSTDWITNSAHILTGNYVWGVDSATYANEDYTSASGYGSISIGHEAGYQQNVSSDVTRRSTHRRNVMIGYQAGRNMPHQLTDGNVFVGSAAGGHRALTYDSSSFADKRMLGNTCIGRRAGYFRDINTGSRQPQRYNVFIGHLAGSDIDKDYSYHGHYNITIGSFPDPRTVAAYGHGVSESHKDLVNANGSSSTNHSYNLNIANLITGDWNTTGSYKKRVKIGDITAGTVQPQGTLELLAADTATTTFFIARAASQGQPLMSVETVSANYNDNPTQTTNQVINKDGFLRIPIFPGRAELQAITASDYPGMVAMYKSGNSNKHVFVYSDGVRWNKTGHSGQTNLPLNF
jgi:hypothetical protein